MSNATRKVAREQARNDDSAGPLPDAVDPTDFWRWQAQEANIKALRAEARAVQAELPAAERAYSEAMAEFSAKYKLGAQDRIDSTSFKITRANQPPVESATEEEGEG